MKKTIGTILMVVGAIFFLLLLLAEVNLAKSGNLPTDIIGWFGNLILPLACIGVFFLGNFLRKK